MDLIVCGLIDIILIIGLIVMAIIGFKKGFMNKVLGIIGILAIIVFSVMYAGQLSQYLIINNVGYWYSDILENITSNINSHLADTFEGTPTIAEIISKGLEVPEFFAKMIASMIDAPETADLVYEVANYLATLCMNVISFFIIFVVLILLLLILKFVAFILRKSSVIKVIDGILGMILCVTIYAVIVSIIFFLLSIVMDMDWFSGVRSWLAVDMKLDDDSAFRISKAIYESNIITKIWNLIF